MKGTNPCSAFRDFTDKQLIETVLKDENALTCIYVKHKEYCINFMKSKQATTDDALDIYQDATIVLYEKIRTPNFELTSSIQTYLNSVCYYQLLARGKTNYNKKIVLSDEIDENIQDWFDDEDDISQEAIDKVLAAFEQLKDNGDKCYERLYLFYYEKLKNDEIARRLELKDASTVKNLINRCRRTLRSMVGSL